MLNPIKRVWVPKDAAAQATKSPVPPISVVPTVAAAPAPSSSPVVASVPTQASAPAVSAPVTPSVSAPRNVLFDSLPEPEVSEKFSDSVWAEFESVLPLKSSAK